ncbi:hypothetical protein FKW77_004895 [Venturia effusa]|uniref:Uncharacterized protein n=1 Tax=Venturia effusa TaxID=50376 RepID=A0A517LR81_9PEZI|nr:hypothetical protein FKW77_004895 [Venturia effusa]
MGLMDRLQAKMELHRIEDRYVKRANRNAYSSDAQYINGEYVYKCRQPVDSPPSRSSKGPTSSKPSKPSSSSSCSKPKNLESSTSRFSDSRDSNRTTSSRATGRSRSTIKWGMFS